MSKAVGSPHSSRSTGSLRRIWAPLTLILLTALTGCLPYSCRREASRALLPSDSLSRSLAESTALDTLDQRWATQGTQEHPLTFPRTVLFGAGDEVLVSDVERDVIVVFDTSGRYVREIADADLSIPYLAGRRGDTLVVFSPPQLRVTYLANGRVAGRYDLDEGLANREDLVYAAAGEEAVFLKIVGPERDGLIVRLGDDGTAQARQKLAHPYWRSSGMLRTWGDSLVSLSGFRPVVDVLPSDLSLPPDTMALRGFDSPMLARSRSFMLGDVHQAPLLSPSAATEGDLLFVLNLRAGWLRIDVFGRDGQLRHRLTQREQEYDQQFFPQDVAVRRRHDGAYDIAVVYSEPRATLELFRWEGPDQIIPPPANAPSRHEAAPTAKIPTTDRGSE